MLPNRAVILAFFILSLLFTYPGGSFAQLTPLGPNLWRSDCSLPRYKVPKDTLVTVYFKENSYELDSSAKEILRAFHQRFFVEDSIWTWRIDITGFADSTGSDSTNFFLSKKRASTTGQFLESLPNGLTKMTTYMALPTRFNENGRCLCYRIGQEIVYWWLGSTRSKGNTVTEAERAKDRKVEIKIVDDRFFCGGTRIDCALPMEDSLYRQPGGASLLLPEGFFVLGDPRRIRECYFIGSRISADITSNFKAFSLCELQASGSAFFDIGTVTLKLSMDDTSYRAAKSAGMAENSFYRSGRLSHPATLSIPFTSKVPEGFRLSLYNVDKGDTLAYNYDIDSQKIVLKTSYFPDPQMRIRFRLRQARPNQPAFSLLLKGIKDPCVVARFDGTGEEQWLFTEDNGLFLSNTPFDKLSIITITDRARNKTGQFRPAQFARRKKTGVYYLKKRTLRKGLK